jgi:deazaflavin-dependent oxidoreductase (nitroreductase family)
MTETTTTGTGSWNDGVIASFRAGDARIANMFDRNALVLLHTTGARSGQERISPLAFFHLEGRPIVIASAAGADQHPAWFFNLQKDPHATIEHWENDEIVKRSVVARVAEGEDRERLWQQVVAVSPGFDDYRKKTDRVIPVVILDTP